LTLQAKKKE